MWVKKSDWDAEVSFRKIVQERAVQQFYRNVQLAAENDHLRLMMGHVPPPLLEEIEEQVGRYRRD